MALVFHMSSDGAGLLSCESEAAVLGWLDLRGLASEGVTLAPQYEDPSDPEHLDSEEIDTEIRSSVEDLAREVGQTLSVFAYPSGEPSPASAAVLRRFGIRAAAFTTEWGLNDLRHADWLRSRRINVGGRSTLAVLRAQLLSRLRWPTSPGALTWQSH